jgi:hypothetical protein
MRRALIATGATIRLWYLALVPCQIGDFVCATFSDRPCPFPMQDSMCGDSKPNNNRKRATARTGNIMLSKDEQINSSLHPLTAQRKLQKKLFIINERRPQIQRTDTPLFGYTEDARLSSLGKI